MSNIARMVSSGFVRGKFILIINMLVMMPSCINISISENQLNHISFVDSMDGKATIIDYYQRPNIGGHLGQDTIVGNFTGQGLDSI